MLEEGGQQVISNIADNIAGIKTPILKDYLQSSVSGALAGVNTIGATQAIEHVSQSVMPIAKRIDKALDEINTEKEMLSVEQDPVKKAQGLQLLNQEENDLIKEFVNYSERSNPVNKQLEGQASEDVINYDAPTPQQILGQQRLNNKEQLQKIKDAINAGNKIDMPTIEYYPDGRFRNQEGFHRALVAKELGIEKIPVLFVNKPNSQPIQADSSEVNSSEGTNTRGDIVNNEQVVAENATSEIKSDSTTLQKNAKEIIENLFKAIVNKELDKNYDLKTARLQWHRHRSKFENKDGDFGTANDYNDLVSQLGINTYNETRNYKISTNPEINEAINFVVNELGISATDFDSANFASSVLKAYSSKAWGNAKNIEDEINQQLNDQAVYLEKQEKEFKKQAQELTQKALIFADKVYNEDKENYYKLVTNYIDEILPEIFPDEFSATIYEAIDNEFEKRYKSENITEKQDKNIGGSSVQSERGEGSGQASQEISEQEQEVDRTPVVKQSSLIGLEKTSEATTKAEKQEISDKELKEKFSSTSKGNQNKLFNPEQFKNGQQALIDTSVVGKSYKIEDDGYNNQPEYLIIDEKYLNALATAKNNTTIGTVGKFIPAIEFKNKKIIRTLKAVKDVKIKKVDLSSYIPFKKDDVVIAYYNGYTKTIYIDISNVSEQVIQNTILHEARHAYQDKTGLYKDTDVEYDNILREKNFNSYGKHIKEIDANNFVELANSDLKLRSNYGRPFKSDVDERIGAKQSDEGRNFRINESKSRNDGEGSVRENSGQADRNEKRSGNNSGVDLPSFVNKKLFKSVETAGAKETETADAVKEWKEKGTESKYFKNWFGDSKVIDAEGKPLVVYHGTQKDKFGFDEFKNDKNMHYFSNDKKYAEEFALWRGVGDGDVYETYLSLKNPLDLTSEKEQSPSSFIKNMRSLGVELSDKAKLNIKSFGTISEQPVWQYIRELKPEDISQLKELGYDGIIQNESINNKTATAYITFSPEQIKSVNNQGTFSDKTGNIYYKTLKARRGSVYIGKVSSWAEIKGRIVKSFKFLKPALDYFLKYGFDPRRYFIATAMGSHHIVEGRKIQVESNTPKSNDTFAHQDLFARMRTILSKNIHTKQIYLDAKEKESSFSKSLNVQKELLIELEYGIAESLPDLIDIMEGKKQAITEKEKNFSELLRNAIDSQGTRVLNTLLDSGYLRPKTEIINGKATQVYTPDGQTLIGEAYGKKEVDKLFRDYMFKSWKKENYFPHVFKGFYVLTIILHLRAHSQDSV